MEMSFLFNRRAVTYTEGFVKGAILSFMMLSIILLGMNFIWDFELSTFFGLHLIVAAASIAAGLLGADDIAKSKCSSCKSDF
jgi:hypothetical protein